MKRKFEIGLALGITLLMAVVLLSAAGPRKDRSHGPRMEGQQFGSGGGMFSERMIEALGLTEEQMEQIDALKQEMKSTVEPLHQQREEIREALKAELELEEPSAVEVGQLVISKRDLSREARQVRESFRESFQAILTPEQLEQLEELKERRHSRRGSHRGFGDQDDPF